MAEINDLDPTDANNTAIGGINSQGSSAPSNMDNVMRALSGMLGRMKSGAAAIYDTMTWCDPADITKKFRFDGGSISAANTRIITIPDANVDLGGLVAASTSAAGISELATDAEAIAKTDTARVLTPSNLAALGGTATFAGLLELATDAETQTGTDTARAITPANLAARTATETRTGVVELATTAEVVTGTDTARAVTPAGVAAKTFVDAMVFIIPSPADGDYRVLKLPFPGTITEVATRSASGTCTLTTKVNSTALGGSANSVSSSEQAQAHASTNTFIADDDIVFTVSSNSSCLKMSVTVKFTRVLG